MLLVCLFFFFLAQFTFFGNDAAIEKIWIYMPKRCINPVYFEISALHTVLVNKVRLVFFFLEENLY